MERDWKMDKKLELHLISLESHSETYEQNWLSKFLKAVACIYILSLIQCKFFALSWKMAFSSLGQNTPHRRSKSKQSQANFILSIMFQLLWKWNTLYMKCKMIPKINMVRVIHYLWKWSISRRAIHEKLNRNSYSDILSFNSF